MPRANRLFGQHHVWHITQRCHKKEFLLKFARDRQEWCRWLFEARRRYCLSVLNYIVTSNHVHLMVANDNKETISKAMQLVAGRTAQKYNQRKNRRGAFWEDRFHAVPITTQAHFTECLVYVDLNMVRAGVVDHPGKWKNSGFHEIQKPRQRYVIIDNERLMYLAGESCYSTFQRNHLQWIDEKLRRGELERDDQWTNAKPEMVFS